MSMKTVNTSNYLFIIFQITSSESPSFISNYFGSLFTHIQEINYMSIHFLPNKVLLIPRTIKIFEDLLSEYAFIRTHRAYLVNELHLKAYDLPNNCVKMSNNMTALISRRRKEMIEQYIV